ncbi:MULTISPECIES: hypothetical protein [Staphylococcaceae]|uniref:Uncharacterized protein n=2 Tax=Staphylococcaceae TaxID=90964 RepID=A0A855GGR7_9STAP|nr:hypothetical protein [Macrococcus caseolyticus]PKE26531.1 hypothetical protein CW686_04435 [Macrococcus caseolyticus]PKE59159.1 hypothetical protein CW673_04045 [Macrococcus caseolyticus]
MKKWLTPVLIFLLIALISLFAYSQYSKNQSLSLEKDKLKLEAAKAKSEADKKSDTENDKNKEDKKKITDNNSDSNEEAATTEQAIVKESVFDANGGWMGDSGSLGFDIYSPSASRTQALKIRDRVYYVMPEEYDQARQMVLTLNGLDENGESDCANVNSRCYYEKQQKEKQQSNDNQPVPNTCESVKESIFCPNGQINSNLPFDPSKPSDLRTEFFDPPFRSGIYITPQDYARLNS